MKIIFILPSVGRKPGVPYVRTWQMEPLAIAVLSSLTPSRVERVFYDDRLEAIPYEEPADAVAISVETYTALRAYRIAERFRARGVRVIMGGFHATLVPDEVMKHADAVVTGNAETVWGQVIDDLAAGALARRYDGADPGFVSALPDRSIYGTKHYSAITLIETGRGCPFGCDFCSISPFFKRRYVPRPVADVVHELQILRPRLVFFIDDNIGVNRNHFLELLKAIEPLHIRWCGQISIHVASDDEVLGMMKRSGCIGVLIGFESLEAENLRSMNKEFNARASALPSAIANIRRHGLGIYATFVFGYDGDSPATFDRTVRFAVEQKFFLAAFNHLVPFPGTPLHERLRAEKRMPDPSWWLSDRYSFGDVAFVPRSMSAPEIASRCLDSRKRFYSPLSIIRRGLEFRANCRTPGWAALFLFLNTVSGLDVSRRQGLRLGEGP
jgi:radical SAM superfamily enzyme YgiQ (UPF0313 family)